MTAFFYGQDDRYVAGAWTRRSDDVQNGHMSRAHGLSRTSCPSPRIRRSNDENVFN